MIPAKQQIAAVASDLLAGNVDPLEACRTIVRLRGSLADADQHDPDLLVFVGIESELDDVPPRSARDLWAPAALAEKEDEATRYLDGVREPLLEASKSLVTRWSA